jgi:hypothetical protein
MPNNMGLQNTVHYTGGDGIAHSAEIYFDLGWPDPSRVQFYIDGDHTQHTPDFRFLGTDNQAYTGNIFSADQHAVPFIWHFWVSMNPGGGVVAVQGIQLFDDQRHPMHLAIERNNAGVPMFVISP